jgi:Family of unknown function (DUF6263)
MQQLTRIGMVVILLGAGGAVHAQTVMAYRFKEGETLHYLMEQKNSTKISVAGADVVMNVNTTVNLAWQVLKVDQGNASVKIRVMHSKISLESLVGNVNVDSNDKAVPNDPIGQPLGQLNKAIAAMEITATMLPTGELKDVKVSDATVKAMQAIPGADKLGDLAHPDNFKDMISGIVFPTTTVEKGKSWSHKVETNTPAGKISADNLYTAEGTVQRDGATLEKIALTPTIKIEANPKAEMKVKSIKASGHTLFDNKSGRIVESTVKQTKEGTVSVMGLNLNQTTDEVTTLKLLKPGEVKGLVKSIDSIKIDEDKYVEKTVATEQLETIAGVSRSFTVERNFETAISIPGMKDKALVEELKGMVESSLSIAIGKKSTVKETLALDGKETTKVNVVWIERSRAGVATRADGSTVPFLVRVGLRIKLEKAK